MKTKLWYTGLLLFIAVLFALSLLADLMALHDIHNDYASSMVISRFAPAASASMPEWTRTTMEWSLLNISFVTRLIATGGLIFFSVIIRMKIIRAGRS